jgi:uncharacterized protein
MFSLQRFLSKSVRFFDLLEASAEEARQSVIALVELIQAPAHERTLEHLIARRRQNKRDTEALDELLCSAFVTPLEREDIEELSSALSRIPKVVKKFAERLVMLPADLPSDHFVKQAELLHQATEVVCHMVKQLRRSPRLDKIQEQNNELHQIEGDADKIMLDLLRELYSGRYEAVQMILLRDLFELLEKVIDRCRDAGNVVFHIVLKNS